jgi:hypothetical protein
MCKCYRHSWTPFLLTTQKILATVQHNCDVRNVERGALSGHTQSGASCLGPLYPSTINPVQT